MLHGQKGKTISAKIKEFKHFFWSLIFVCDGISQVRPCILSAMEKPEKFEKLLWATMIYLSQQILTAQYQI